MKLALNTLSFDHWSPEQTVQFCIENGYQGLELRELIGTWFSLDLDAAVRTKLKHFFRDAKLKVTNIGSGLCFKGNAADQLKDHGKK